MRQWHRNAVSFGERLEFEDGTTILVNRWLYHVGSQGCRYAAQIENVGSSTSLRVRQVTGCKDTGRMLGAGIPHRTIRS